jgi:hypothetical protein
MVHLGNHCNGPMRRGWTFVTCYERLHIMMKTDHAYQQLQAVTKGYTIPDTGKGFELAATLLGEFKQKGTLFELNLS